MENTPTENKHMCKRLEFVSPYMENTSIDITWAFIGEASTKTKPKLSQITIIDRIE